MSNTVTEWKNVWLITEKREKQISKLLWLTAANKIEFITAFNIRKNINFGNTDF